MARRSDEIDIGRDMTISRQTGRRADRQTDRPTYRPTNIKDRQTHRQTDRQTDRANRQTGRRTDGWVGESVKTHLAGLPGADVHPSESYGRQLQPAVLQIGFPHRR